jgi:hypothetical protein
LHGQIAAGVSSGSRQSTPAFAHRSMSLLYFHSPLPPAETGIADYAFETLVRLNDQFDIVIVDDGNCRAAADALLLPTIPIEVWRDLRTRSRKGLDVYHLGNNQFHTGILERALGHPGLCVIHDASLTGLLLSSPALWPVFKRFTEYELGVNADTFIEARDRFEIFGWQDFLLRNLGLVADSSLGYHCALEIRRGTDQTTASVMPSLLSASSSRRWVPHARGRCHQQSGNCRVSARK